MPFKSDKQRKWMYANEPDMAKKWEKEEVIRGKLRNLIKQEMKSINEAKPKSFKFKFQCMECGKSFIKSLKKSLEVKCPKCKSVDIELENVNEDNIKFSKEEMAQLHKDGKLEKNGHTIEFGESINESSPTSRQLKAIQIAIDMAGNMTGAVKKIEKLKRGLSKDKKIKDILRLVNESINEGFEKYHLGGLLDSRLKKRLERVIKIWGGKIDAVGDDYIKFRLSSFEVKKFPALLKKLDRNKNVWIGDKRKNNIWDRRRNIDKLGEAQFFRAKQMVLLPDKKMYFDPMNNNLWLMGPYGGPDMDDDPIEPRDRDYNKIIRKLSSKDKSVLKKAMRTRKRRKEATTSVSVPGYLTPLAFKKSTQKAIDVDDEDDEKNESIKERVAHPFSKHLRNAQEEVEYMISYGPEPDGDDDIYDRPKQAMKLLQVAQKALGRIS